MFVTLPDHAIVDDLNGTDLELSYNLRGRDLILRINKNSVKIFRVLLLDAAKDFTAGKLVNFSAVSPDCIFQIGTQTRQLQQESLEPQA